MLNLYSWWLFDSLMFMSVVLNFGNVVVCGFFMKRDNLLFVRIVLIFIVNNYVDCFIYNRFMFKIGCFIEFFIINVRIIVLCLGEIMF